MINQLAIYFEAGAKLGVALLLLLGSVPALAQTDSYDTHSNDTNSNGSVLIGRAPSEVIALYGKPAEKIEQEVRRREIWIFPSKLEVVFEEGEVISSRELTPVDSGEEEVTEKSDQQVTPARQLEQSEVEEILSEIMGEPTEGEGDAASGRPLVRER